VALSFRNDYLGMDNVYWDLDSGKCAPKQQADLTSFVATWLKNIKEQQGI